MYPLKIDSWRSLLSVLWAVGLMTQEPSVEEPSINFSCWSHNRLKPKQRLNLQSISLIQFYLTTPTVFIDSCSINDGEFFWNSTVVDANVSMWLIYDNYYVHLTEIFPLCLNMIQWHFLSLLTLLNDV